MKLPPYPKTKPSGVEWLGDVPEHWEVKRLKTSATCWVSNVDKVPAEDELPVRLCNYTDVYYHDHITPNMGLMETTATADEIRRFGLRVGDVVITKDSEEWSDIAVPALVKKTAPDLVCGYHLAIIRSRPKALLGDYLLRAFQSCAVNQQFQVAASGVTRYGLPKACIGDAWIPLPDLAEQRAIAAFLDRETGRVDRLVAMKRQLIERLKEKRTALISRTVTRGLPPAAARAAGLPTNPPLKPSGVAWLNEIPAHWKASKVRHYVSILSGFAFPSAGFTRDDSDMRLLRGINVGVSTIRWDDTVCWSRTPGDGLGMFELKGGSLVIGMDRPWVSEGVRVAILSQDDVPCLLLQRVAAIRPNRHLSRDYLFRILSSPMFVDYFTPEMTGVSVPHISPGQIGNFPLPVPPLPEQAAIAAYLDVETAKLDALVGKVAEAVERLQEYRSALITAAVTGKIDVRRNIPRLTP